MYLHLHLGRKSSNFSSQVPTGVAQWAGHCPTNRKVNGLIPGWGTHLGREFGPRSGCVRKATDRCFSLQTQLCCGRWFQPIPHDGPCAGPREWRGSTPGDSSPGHSVSPRGVLSRLDRENV